MENTNNITVNKEVIEEKKPRITGKREIDKNFIMIPNTLWDNLNITNEELTIYILLYRNHASFRDNISITSIKMLTDYMYVNINNNKNIVTSIKKAIISLVVKKFIKKIYDIHYNELLIEYKTVDDEEIFDKFYYEILNKETGELEKIDFDIDKNTFFFVELEPPQENDFLQLQDTKIDKIFYSLQGKNISKYNMIRYYIACCRVTNNEQNFGYLSQKRLEKLIHDTRTITRYNQILAENELIRYDNSYVTPEQHYCCTILGKYDDDIKNWEFQIECTVSEKGWIVKTDKKVSNKKRSIKAKINNTEKKIAETELEKENRELKEQLAKFQKEHDKLQYTAKDKERTEENKKVKHIGKEKPKSLNILLQNNYNWGEQEPLKIDIDDMDLDNISDDEVVKAVLEDTDNNNDEFDAMMSGGFIEPIKSKRPVL